MSLLQILFKGKGEFLDDLGFVLFSFFNVVWATLYLESWKRRQAELSYQWGTIDTKGALLSEPRVQYQVQIMFSQWHFWFLFFVNFSHSKTMIVQCCWLSAYPPVTCTFISPKLLGYL